MIAQSTVQRVHDRADILDVVSRYHVELTRKGSLHVGRCPFHQEKTGSFTVYPNRNNFHCYGCGKHGSAIDFVMEMEGISYPEAIENLANMFGIQVEHVQREQTCEEIAQAKHIEALRLVMERAQEFFVEQLDADTPEAANARQYAFSRWGEQYCRELGLGFAPDSFEALPQWAEAKCVDLPTLAESSILGLSEKTKRYYSFFRSRITIPIRDRYGRIISYTARYIGDSPSEMKYLNGRNTPLFKKNETVFGLRTASRRASQAGRFIIVEGAPDVLRLQSDDVGLTETVATLGTAWGEEQFKQLQRYAPALVFIPDADPPKEGEAYGPGIKAVMKNGQLALKLGFEVSVREISVGTDADGNPQKADPDSFITSTDVFARLEDVPFPVWYGLKLLDSCQTENEKVKALKDVCHNVLLHISDDTLLSRCIAPLAKEYGGMRLWRDALRSAKLEEQREAERSKREKLTGEQAAMRELGFFVKDGGYASYDKEGEVERWSNFTMEPLFHITEGDRSIRIFKLKNERGTVKEVEFKQEELVSLSRFIERVESLGFFIFKGDNIKLQNLKQYLYSITNSAMQISKMGWNAAEELYVFGDAVYSENVLYEANDLGIAQVGERTFYLPAFSKMHIDKADAFQFERSFCTRNHGEINLHDYLQRMVTVFGDNAKVGFAFVLATLFLDVVKQSSKRLALLNIFGRKGSGKTELGTALMSFFIRQNDPPSLATTSLSSLNEMLSNAENNLVHLDEYKNEIDFRKIELLKQIWGGSGQTKRNMDGDKKVQRTYVRSGVILTGQDAPTRDDALFSRVIHLTYSQVTFSKEAKRNFEEFQAIASRGVSHLTVQLLKLRKVFESDYASHYSTCKRELMAVLCDEEVEDRLLNNWLAPLAAFHTVQMSLDLPFPYKDLFNICLSGIRRQNEQLKKNSDIAVFWTLLDTGLGQGKAVNKAHFKISMQDKLRISPAKIIDFECEKKLLYLNYNMIVESLGQKQNGSAIVGKLDKMSLQSYLRTHPAYLGTVQTRFWVLGPMGQPEYTCTTLPDGRVKKRVNDKRYQALVFDYNMIREAYEIDLETGERDPNASEREDADASVNTAPPAHTPTPTPPRSKSLWDESTEEDNELPF